MLTHLYPPAALRLPEGDAFPKRKSSDPLRQFRAAAVLDRLLALVYQRHASGLRRDLGVALALIGTHF